MVERVPAMIRRERAEGDHDKVRWRKTVERPARLVALVAPRQSAELDDSHGDGGLVMVALAMAALSAPASSRDRMLGNQLWASAALFFFVRVTVTSGCW